MLESEIEAVAGDIASFSSLPSMASSWFTPSLSFLLAVEEGRQEWRVELYVRDKIEVGSEAVATVRLYSNEGLLPESALKYITLVSSIKVQSSHVWNEA